MRIDERYELVQPLGGRKSGAVWQATDTKTERRVAVAVVEADDGDDERRVADFLDLMRKVASIEDSSVIKIHDYGEEEKGRGYAVMQELEGRTLAERLADDAPMSLADFLLIISQALEGLAKLHDQGLLHGDIEPGNIYLEERAGRPTVKLIGTGHSRAAARAPSQGDDTEAARLLRSLAYASPEQAKSLSSIERSSDLYSMGAIIFHALTNRLPHGGSTDEELRESILNERPPLLHEVREEIPTSLSQVIEKALAAKAKARHESAREMQQALLSSMLMAPEDVKKSALPVRMSASPRSAGDGSAEEKETPKASKEKPVEKETVSSDPSKGPSKAKSGAPASKQEAGGPKKEAAKPKQEAGGPKKEAAKPKQEAGGPKKEAAKPKQEAGGPKKEAAKPKQEAGGPKKEAAKPKSGTLSIDDAMQALDSDALEKLDIKSIGFETPPLPSVPSLDEMTQDLKAEDLEILGDKNAPPPPPKHLSASKRKKASKSTASSSASKAEAEDSATKSASGEKAESSQGETAARAKAEGAVGEPAKRQKTKDSKSRGDESEKSTVPEAGVQPVMSEAEAGGDDAEPAKSEPETTQGEDDRGKAGSRVEKDEGDEKDDDSAEEKEVDGPEPGEEAMGKSADDLDLEIEVAPVADSGLESGKLTKLTEARSPVRLKKIVPQPERAEGGRLDDEVLEEPAMMISREELFSASLDSVDFDGGKKTPLWMWVSAVILVVIASVVVTVLVKMSGGDAGDEGGSGEGVAAVAGGAGSAAPVDAGGATESGGGEESPGAPDATIEEQAPDAQLTSADAGARAELEPADAEPEAREAAPELVTVTLRGVPAGARVSLEGELVEGSELRLPGDGVSRRVEITAAGYQTWRRRIISSENTSINVRMQRRSASRGGRRSGRGGGGRTSKSGSGLVRNPGF